MKIDGWPRMFGGIMIHEMFRAHGSVLAKFLGPG